MLYCMYLEVLDHLFDLLVQRSLRLLLVADAAALSLGRRLARRGGGVAIALLDTVVAPSSSGGGGGSVLCGDHCSLCLSCLLCDQSFLLSLRLQRCGFVLCFGLGGGSSGVGLFFILFFAQRECY